MKELSPDRAGELIKSGMEGFHSGRGEWGHHLDSLLDRVAFNAGWKAERALHEMSLDRLAAILVDGSQAPTPQPPSLLDACIALLDAWDIDAAEEDALGQPLRVMNAVISIRHALGDAAPARAVPDQSRVLGGIVAWLITKDHRPSGKLIDAVESVRSMLWEAEELSVDMYINVIEMITEGLGEVIPDGAEPCMGRCPGVFPDKFI